MPLRIGYPYAYSNWTTLDPSESIRVCTYLPDVNTRVQAMIRTSGSGPYTMSIRAGVEPDFEGTVPTEPGPHSRNPGLGITARVILKEGCKIGSGEPGIVVIRQRLGPDMSAREVEQDEVSMIMSPGIVYMIKLENCSEKKSIDVNWIISWYENVDAT